MELRALAPQRHIADRHAVGELLPIEFQSLRPFFLVVDVVKIGKVKLRRIDRLPLQRVGKLPEEGLGRAAVKGDMVNRHMQYHRAVRQGVQHGAHRNPAVQMEGDGVAVDQADDFVAAVRRFFLNFGQSVGQHANGKSVLFAVEGVERLVRTEHFIQSRPDLLRVRTADDRRHVEVVDRAAGRSLNQQALDHAGSPSGENIARGNFVERAFRRDHRAFDGVAAEGEEIVVNADMLHRQHGFKRTAERPLHVGFRRGEVGLEAAGFGRRQRASIQFAVGVDGELFQPGEEGGDHVGRKPACHPAPQLLRVERLLLHVIGGEIYLSELVLEILDRCVENAVRLLDDGFNLARLDALTVDLDHPVASVEEEDVAVRQFPDDVAGAQHTREAVLLRKGVGNEGFRALLREMKVFRSKATRQAKLALLGGISLVVQNIRPLAADRLADGSIVVCPIHPEGKRAGGFRLSVHHRQLEFVGKSIGNALAAGVDAPEGMSLGCEHSEHFGTDEEMVDLMRLNKVRQQHRVAHGFRRHDHAGQSLAEREENVMHRHDEGKGRRQRGSAALRQAEILIEAQHRIADAAVGMQHALGLSGGAGGVDDQRGRVVLRVGCALERGTVRRAAQELLIDGSLRAAVAADKGQPFLRVGRGQRNIRRANQPHGVKRGDKLLPPWQLDRDKVALAHARRDKLRRDLAGGLPELSEGEGAACGRILENDVIRSQQNDLFDASR